MEKQNITKYNPQYMSYIFDDWTNICEATKTLKAAEQAIRDYHKRYPAGTKMFRIETVVMEKTIVNYSPNGRKLKGKLSCDF